MSVLPGNWRAAKDLVRKTTSAVLDKTGALYTPAVDHIRNLVTNKSDIVVQRAPVLGQQPVVPICQQIPTPPTQGLLISCMLVLLSFTLGWWWGARQQRSHQAMLQAQAADKRTEELATLSLPASSSSDSKQLSTAAIAPAMYATSGDQQEQSNSMTAPLGQHQSAGPSEQSVPGPLVLPDSQRSSSPLQQAITPETEAAPSSSEQAADLGQLQELAVAAANQQPSSVDSADGVDPVPKTQLNSADAVHADGQPSCSQTSSTSAALTVPYLTAGQALDDPIGSAAGLYTNTSALVLMHPGLRAPVLQPWLAQYTHHTAQFRRNLHCTSRVLWLVQQVQQRMVRAVWCRCVDPEVLPGSCNQLHAAGGQRPSGFGAASLWHCSE